MSAGMQARQPEKVCNPSTTETIFAVVRVDEMVRRASRAERIQSW